MPQRKITVPPPITLSVPVSGILAMPGAPSLNLTFLDFLELAFQNPLWNDNWKSALAQQSIYQAAQKAEEDKVDTFTIAEEDWEMLDRAVKTPRVAGEGGTQLGFGLKPGFARHLIPMCNAVIKAEQIT